ncbi:hypothetical protein DFP72DRAFT_882294 [Ephemerocybe angulata]|uniref:NACHT domain-containing protein n=1 Tax=Ephemerocybe angulata TaxID=980116 RepID=A0A8H6I9S3_9AGAR|nr:hypothetical protein DFP72DRAFT_882294 [Tulosesus angulatus]
MAFNKARNFSIANATMTATTIEDRRTFVQWTPAPVDPMSLLREAREVEATHTSKTAVYAPKCKPGSREQIIGDIVGWVQMACSAQGYVPPRSLLWFQGPAGGGKTCIMREVAGRCQQQGLLAATYFFSTRVPGLNREDPFVATVVYQLTSSMPNLKPSILEAISNNSSIFEESLETQVDMLVLNTMEAVAFPQRMVIVVDGLDECQSRDERADLLEVLRKLSRSFVVIMASRPDFDIRTTFSTPEFERITHSIRLQSYDATKDIRTFFCDGFHNIRQTHPARASLPESWPAERILNILIEKSSGCYAYPATVMKYVNNPQRHPVSLLEEVLELSPHPTQETPLKELDALYGHILSTSGTDRRLMKCILHSIMCLHLVIPTEGDFCTVYLSSSPAFLDQLLCLSPGTTDIVLHNLHSLISIPEPNAVEGQIMFHHKSLEDYLKSEEPLCVLHLRKWEEEPEPTDQHSRASAAFYACNALTHHLARTGPSDIHRVGDIGIGDLGLKWKYRIAYVNTSKNGSYALWDSNVPWRLCFEHHDRSTRTSCILCVFDNFNRSRVDSIKDFTRIHGREDGQVWNTAKIKQTFAKFDQEIVKARRQDISRERVVPGHGQRSRQLPTKERKLRLVE